MKNDFLYMCSYRYSCFLYDYLINGSFGAKATVLKKACGLVCLVRATNPSHKTNCFVFKRLYLPLKHSITDTITV